MNNPDPARCYPVLVVGIDALKARFDRQQAEAQKLREHSRAIKEVVEAVELSHTQVGGRFAALQMRQIGLYQRLLALLRKVEVLRCRGTPLQQAELRWVMLEVELYENYQ